MRLLRKRLTDTSEETALICTTTVPVTASLFMRGQLSAMRERGWRVTLVSSPGNELQMAGVREGVKTIELPMERELSPFRDLWALCRWIRLLVGARPAVVSAGTPKAGLLAMVAGAIAHVGRRVYVVRGLRYEGSHGIKRWLLQKVEWVTCALATDVIVVSPSVAAKLRRDRVYGRSMLLIGSGSSNGVHPKPDGMDVVEMRRIVRAELQVADSDYVVGFVGRPSPDKGGDVLSGASDLLAQWGVDHTLLIVGGDQPPEKRSAHARTIGIPWVENPLRYMCAFDVLALPTLREGFPNVVLEAATVGVPTVTTYATGARDSVVDGETGLLVVAGSAGELAKALSAMKNSPERRSEMGAAALERALCDFSPGIIWQGLDSVYRGEVPHCPFVQEV